MRHTTGRLWISSDWHLGHTNIAGPKVSEWKSGYRIFDNTHHMNQTIINNINTWVAEDDTIIFNGDFCFGGHYKTPDFRRQIMCKNIHVVRGNHDHHINKYADYFNSIQDYLEVWVKHGGKDYCIIVSHYALRVWNGSHKGYLHAYGHSHDTLPPFGKSHDVGIDTAYRIVGEYRPFAIEEFIDHLANRDTEFPDHHTKNTNVR